MNIAIVEKDLLTDKQLHYIKDMLADPDHANDKGVTDIWDVYINGLYAVVDSDTGNVVGLVEASGPITAINPGW